MSDWTSIHDIMQDLSLVQGFVPASVEAVGSSRPPTLKIEEDNEEQAYYGCGGGGDIKQPDYELIKQMLDMVKEKKDGDSDSPTSDLDPLSPEFVPLAVQKKIKRNVALSSIITAKENELAAKRPIAKHVIPIMFKRKSNSSTESGVKSTSSSPLQASPSNEESPSKGASTSKVTSPQNGKQYVPSAAASEYYSKFLKNKQIREQFEGDIWTRAERQMKDIDDRKKREAEALRQFQEQCDSFMTSEPLHTGVPFIDLPHHRHRLTGKCAVCQVILKHGYEFKIKD